MCPECILTFGKGGKPGTCGWTRPYMNNRMTGVSMAVIGFHHRLTVRYNVGCLRCSEDVLRLCCEMEEEGEVWSAVDPFSKGCRDVS